MTLSATTQWIGNKFSDNVASFRVEKFYNWYFIIFLQESNIWNDVYALSYYSASRACMFDSFLQWISDGKVLL